MDRYVHVCTAFASPEAAFAHAVRLIEPGLDVIGDFVLPPSDAPPSRTFQTLHFDFGLPVRPVRPADIARYTALHVPASTPLPEAATRLVDLTNVHPWPANALPRLEAYGRTHGAFDDSEGYYEGSFARLCEAALAAAPALPSLKHDPAFLCGTEFATFEDERAFLDALGVSTPETEIVLAPGELLVFDNLAVAHGRRGTRRPGELRQRVYGHSGLDSVGQRRLRDRVLNALASHQQLSRRPLDRSLRARARRRRRMCSPSPGCPPYP